MITVTTLKGTSSISADRITINNNFDILSNKINELLSIVDTDTGAINNTNIGTNNTVTTEAIYITGVNGLNLSANANITLQSGNIILSSPNSKIQLGATSSIDYKVATVNTPGKEDYVDFSNLLTGVLPKSTTTEILNITTPVAGMIVYDTTLDVVKVYSSGVWKVLQFV